MFSIRRTVLGFGAIVVALTLAACSSGSTTTSDSGTSTLSETAQKQLDTAYAGIGSKLDDLTPVTAQKDVNLYVVSCGQSVPSCANVADSMVAAGKAVGWTTNIADGKLSPDGFAAAIRQAIAGKATVIIPVGIGCGVAQAAFKEAVDAGIKIIGGGGVDDCSPKLWASERLWMPDTTPQQMWEEIGAQQAEYAYGKTNGAVKAVVLNFTTQTWGPWLTAGFTNKIKELNGGSVVATVDVSDPETADGSFIQKVTTALLAHSDANTLIVPVDGWLSNGLAAAIKQANLDDQLLVVSRGGDGPALDLIRQGNSGIDATIGFAYEWGGWGSVDTAIRVLAGQEPVYIGDYSQAIDKDHNMTTSGAYQGPVDYKAKFKAAWGVS